ncbi:hypothetical protein GCM10022222_55740 [Amycolatopsis ultiminotia]|uniref:Uncharacterized protein n=1 Tax=Amycolatopsis ultiminotia TaxID=543629 RepID=A0ABP6XHQ2_9PSEU
MGPRAAGFDIRATVLSHGGRTAQYVRVGARVELRGADDEGPEDRRPRPGDPRRTRERIGFLVRLTVVLGRPGREGRRRVGRCATIT